MMIEWSLVFSILAKAIPSTLGSYLSFLQETTNLVFIGHLNNPFLISAVGMGNIIINCCGLSLIWGLNSALESLASQAYGAK
jgi:Na+-driven multidrug efflux pump